MLLFAELDAAGYAIVIGAACVGVGGIVSSVATLIIGYFDRQRQADREDARKTQAAAVEAKIDNNTMLTQRAGVAAHKAAEKAEDAAIEKTNLLNDIRAHVNGGLAAALDTALGPLRKQMKEHEAADEANVREVNATLRAVLEALERQAARPP